MKDTKEKLRDNNNYTYVFINNAHIGGQGDNNYKTAIENKLDDIL